MVWRPVSGSLRRTSNRCVSVLLLASASPARRRLLDQAGIPHRVRVSGVDEQAITAPTPALLVRRLAEAKAQTVHQALDPLEDAEIRAVLGCDSVLVFEGEIFGKPADSSEAVQRWRRMAGGVGELMTGHCLLPVDGDPVISCVTTGVQFAPLTFSEIDAYVATGEPLQCAGGFALEGRGGLCVAGLAGCYSNVIGLSLPWLRQQLPLLAN